MPRTSRSTRSRPGIGGPGRRRGRLADQLGESGQPAPAGIRYAGPPASGPQQRRRPAPPRRAPPPIGSQHSWSSGAAAAAGSSPEASGVPAAASHSRSRRPVEVKRGRRAFRRPCSQAGRERRQDAGCTTYERRVARPRSAPSSPRARAAPARRRARAPARRRRPAPRAGRCRPSGPPRPARRAARPGRRPRLGRLRAEEDSCRPRRHPGSSRARRSVWGGASRRRSEWAASTRRGISAGAAAPSGVTEPAQRHSGTSSKACLSSSELSLLVSSALGVVLLVERSPRRPARRRRRPSAAPVARPSMAVPGAAVGVPHLRQRAAETGGDRLAVVRLRDARLAPPCGGPSRWPARPRRRAAPGSPWPAPAWSARSSAACGAAGQRADLGAPRGERAADRGRPGPRAGDPRRSRPSTTTIVARTTVSLPAADARHVRMRCSVRPLARRGTGPDCRGPRPTGYVDRGPRVPLTVRR